MASNQVGYQIKRLQQALRTAMDEQLREVGLTTPQYAALSALEEMPGASGAAVARYCFVTPQTMNEIVGNLLAAGLIERRPHPENGRVLQMYLTPAGEAQLTQAHARIKAVEQRMLAPLDAAAQAQLSAWLQACSRVLEEAST